MYILILILVLIYYVYINYRFKSSRYYKLIKAFPPVTTEVPLIGALWKFVGGPEQLMAAVTHYINLATKVGGSARIYLFTLYYIVICDARDAAVVLRSSLEKDYLYKFLRTFSGNGSAFVSGPIAKERRAVLVPSFHPRTLFSFVDVFWEESRSLADSLAAHDGKGPFSVEKYLYKYNIGTILRAGNITLSKVYSDEFYKALTRWEGIAKERMVSVWKHPDFLYKYSSLYEESRKVVETLHHYAHKILHLRLEEIKRHSRLGIKEADQRLKEGIFDAIINSNLDEEAKREEIIVLIVGTDLVGLSLGFTMMLLGMYPEVQNRVYRELQDIFGGSDRPVTKEDLAKLTYVDMVIKESLRLYPPVPVIARKVLKDVALPSGRTIPAGTGVCAAIMGIHKNQKYWGADAECFDPDRFSTERFEGVPPQAYMPFSFGPRNCIGYKYGQISMKVVLSTILRRYRIVGKPAAGPLPEIKTKLRIFTRSQDDFTIELVSRK
ncbi:cytochrome P450 4c21-like [Aricia agestis]|uniref:cytochrome P450 4c21-like n=1 Tax=Aricia agestis TaxID=91739 RepID=UPI001C2071A5|nr:cytochrome P450 4c21-like [Aricia agestis]